MYRIDDPVLSLILRFILSEEDLKKPDEEFIRRQIVALTKYLEKFPDHEKDQHAIEWIEQHAKQYRRKWEKQIIPLYASKMQCADCPMKDTGGKRHCVVHSDWLRLLKAYCEETISTQTYIESSLELLQTHKNHLKEIKRFREKKEN